jgi:drug/metabolite transporter (DMT)-like permease
LVKKLLPSFLVGVLRDMWESICLTLAATAGNNIGKVLQKKGTIILPPLSLKLKVLRAYAENKPWALGFLMDIVGALLMLRALSLAPVSVVQPVSGCGLAILSVFSHFYLKEVMNVFDWIGITVAGIGTIGVGAGGEEQEASLISVFQLLWLALVVAILFVLLNAWLHIFKRQRREQELGEYEVVEEIIYGLESGILFGMASVVSKMGFVFVEQGFSTMFIPMCISISICCSGTGFFYQTRGLKHGRAIVVSTCAAVASIVTGVVAGMFALGEKLPTSPSGRLLLLLGWLLIMLGVVLLVTSSRLIRHLPRSFRRSRQTSLERGFNIRRTTSHTPKDTNPSAVIQAATLHHLLSSPSKDKD